MTYLQFHLVFIVPVIGILVWMYRRRHVAGRSRHSLKWLFVLPAIALAYTTIWDNYLVYRGVWSYGNDRVIGTIGYVPVEEYLFFLLQPLLTGLWFYILAYESTKVLAGNLPGKARWIGGGVYLVITGLGGYFLMETAGLYMGLILVWASPVLAGQWMYAGNWIWASRRLWMLGTLAPTLYLWVADRVALALGIWEISMRYTTGWHLAGLPLEEAAFFLVTNLLVVQGLIMFLHIGDPAKNKSATKDTVQTTVA